MTRRLEWAVLHVAVTDRRAVLRMIASQAGRAVLRSACANCAMWDVSAALITATNGLFSASGA